MSPPDYPWAWLHPCRARFCFTRQSHCKPGTDHFFLCCRLAAQLPLPARLFQLAITRRVDFLLAACQHAGGRHVADGAVQAHVIVVIDILLNQPFGV